MLMKQIEAFVAVVKHRSFSRAAEDLFLSQPTISAHIRSLEEELGVQLINRTTKNVIPTEAGRFFYEYAITTLGARDDMKRTLTNFRYEMKGTTCIYAHSVPGQYVVPFQLQSFIEQYPDIRIQVQETTDSKVIESITGMRAQLGITSSRVRSPICVIQKIYTDYYTVVAPNIPKYEKKRFYLKDLQTIPFVGWKRGSELDLFFHSFFQSLNIELKDCSVMYEADSFEGALQAVRNGFGITVTTKLCAESLISTDELIELPFDFAMPPKEYYIVYHRNRPLNPISAAIKNFLINDKNKGE